MKHCPICSKELKIKTNESIIVKYKTSNGVKDILVKIFLFLIAHIVVIFFTIKKRLKITKFNLKKHLKLHVNVKGF